MYTLDPSMCVSSGLRISAHNTCHPVIVLPIMLVPHNLHHLEARLYIRLERHLVLHMDLQLHQPLPSFRCPILLHSLDHRLHQRARDSSSPVPWMHVDPDHLIHSSAMSVALHFREPEFRRYLELGRQH
ncbi:hypothetical protein FA95DRAFT_282529 [Auriscalpium vulgare]|uniref:Uncharacterized protein n=1 Tax=Auriscalpium vulgare TaxID=40419 RepID=A0ACB8S6U3_9AGAM|nr:hypothetical protein FA95DRAFT_282529 [Auriscalpium vulgare]